MISTKCRPTIVSWRTQAIKGRDAVAEVEQPLCKDFDPAGDVADLPTHETLSEQFPGFEGFRTRWEYDGYGGKSLLIVGYRAETEQERHARDENEKKNRDNTSAARKKQEENRRSRDMKELARLQKKYAGTDTTGQKGDAP